MSNERANEVTAITNLPQSIEVPFDWKNHRLQIEILREIADDQVAGLGLFTEIHDGNADPIRKAIKAANSALKEPDKYRLLILKPFRDANTVLMDNHKAWVGPLQKEVDERDEKLKAFLKTKQEEVTEERREALVILGQVNGIMDELLKFVETNLSAFAGKVESKIEIDNTFEIELGNQSEAISDPELKAEVNALIAETCGQVSNIHQSRNSILEIVEVMDQLGILEEVNSRTELLKFNFLQNFDRVQGYLKPIEKKAGQKARVTGLRKKINVNILDAYKLPKDIMTDPTVVEALQKATLAYFKETGEEPEGTKIWESFE